MAQKDKDILLKDLCARLSYGVLIQEKCLENVKMFLPNQETDRLINIDVSNRTLITNGGSFYHVDEIKPYLFPLSSMTEEQEGELKGLLSEVYDFSFRMDECLEFIQEQKVIPFRFIDWLDKNNFDYRGLISMGLAIDATDLNIY